MFQKALRRLRRDGVAGVLAAAAERRNAFEERLFDRRFGIETRGIIEDLSAHGAAGPNLEHAVRYEPIQLPVYRRIERALPVAARDYDFVDYGCGKGRALILAAESGFRRMIGVEFAPRLLSVAERNIAAYRARRPHGGAFEVVSIDATEYEPPSNPAVLFFYNPFDAPVMARVLERLDRAWQRHRADWLLVYRNARHEALFEQRAWLAPVAEDESFRIWRAAPDAGVSGSPR